MNVKNQAYLPNCPDNTGRPVMPCFCPVEETLPCCNRANPKIALFCPVEHQFCPVEIQFCPVEQLAPILALSPYIFKKFRLRANYIFENFIFKMPSVSQSVSQGATPRSEPRSANPCVDDRLMYRPIARGQRVMTPPKRCPNPPKSALPGQILAFFLNSTVKCP